MVCPVLQPSRESPIEVPDFKSYASHMPTMTRKLAGKRLGIDPEQPLEGARLECEPSVFPAGLVFAKGVVMSLLYYSVSALGQHKSYGRYMMIGWSGPTRWSTWSMPRK